MNKTARKKERKKEKLATPPLFSHGFMVCTLISFSHLHHPLVKTALDGISMGKRRDCVRKA